jgi:hypothetical protein
MAAYQVVTAADKRQLSDFLIREGQFLIPIVKLIEQSELAIEQVIDVTGRDCGTKPTARFPFPPTRP